MVATATTESTPRTAMAVRGISKRFGTTQALDNVDFEFRWGEVHALVGGNGSGKSTLIKIMAGVYSADAGVMQSGDASWDLAHHTPEEAARAGLRFVHQDLGIFPILTVADNLAIGHGFDTDRTGRIRQRASQRSARATLRRFNVDVDPRVPASWLSTPQRALLAIARALQDIDEDRRAVLFLDEPTAAFPAEEAKLLLGSIKRLAEGGHAIVLVSHRLDEVREVADRVTGIRDGRNAGTMDARTLSESDIVELILGTRLPKPAQITLGRHRDQPILEARRLTGGPIRDLDLAVSPGEIVGLAGLLGSGRTELLELLFGVRPIESGELIVNGSRVRRPTTRRMSAAGLALVPEDRLASGVLPAHSVGENMTAGHLRPYFRGLRLRHRRIRRDVRRDLARYAVKASGAEAPIESLSGGNQQKVVLGRWLRERPAVLLLDEPTQGIDVGAREAILSLVVEASAQGTAVILASSEFEELTRLCHRVVVLARGRKVAEHPRGMNSHELLEEVLTSARSIPL